MTWLYLWELSRLVVPSSLYNIFYQYFRLDNSSTKTLVIYFPLKYGCRVLKDDGTKIIERKWYVMTLQLSYLTQKWNHNKRYFSQEHVRTKIL